MKVLQACDYGLMPDSGANATPRLRELMDILRDEVDCILRLDKGTYHFYPEGAARLTLYVPNHDEDGEKSVAFDLSQMQNLMLDGCDSTFIFHGEIMPFYLGDAENVILQNFFISYARPPYSEGTLLTASPRELTLRIDPVLYPWEVRDNQIFFMDGDIRHPLDLWLEMDEQTNAPAYDTHDLYVRSEQNAVSLSAERLSPDSVRFRVVGDSSFWAGSKPGHKLILRHHPRNHPAFFIKDSACVRLENVTVHHAMGMGLIAEHSRDIDLERFKTALDKEEKSCFTVCADATHFVHCSGTIRLSDCLFENQLDDGINVHGIYGRIMQAINAHTLQFELVHPQQLGVYLGKPGEHLDVMSGSTMTCREQVTIKRLKRLTPSLFELETEEALATLPYSGDVLENADAKPHVIIERCVFRNNRARGVLLTCKTAVVSQCLFQVPGTAVLIEGDAKYWFESGAVTDIRLENNRFDTCSYVSDWGKAPIQVSPTVPARLEGKYFHGSLQVTGNEFACIDDRLLNAHDIGSIQWQQNTLTHSDAYPPILASADPFSIEHVGSLNHD